ncbi:MAG: cell division protein ZapA [Rhodobacteraceae bacterium]|nr:cell division protein ZapA [Paracoccaceae bacterium]
MPEVIVTIGGRNFEVACQEGEEHFLHTAARMLDTEAEALASQIGRLPEPRMLLMAGLMLADKTADLEEELRSTRALLQDAEARASAAESRPPQKVEVPVVPQSALDALGELAARAESLAEAAEEVAAPTTPISARADESAEGEEPDDTAEGGR